MKVLSLGWGVQSFTMAAMVALGELDPIDVAIHADTLHERQLTYEFAKQWTPWLEIHGVKVVTVGNSKSQPAINQWGGVMIPAYTITPMGKGRINRQCTGEWKIRFIRKWLQSHRNGDLVEQWIGISLDEFFRMKDSDVKYITNRYPLVEKKMTRNDCATWLKAHDLEVPPRSACNFCPFHNSAEWHDIKVSPKDWQEAVEVDLAIREARPPYYLYVHPSRRPLEKVDFRTAEERGQLRLWDEECSGMCGV
jgi:hypothetical protein